MLDYVGHGHEFYFEDEDERLLWIVHQNYLGFFVTKSSMDDPGVIKEHEEFRSYEEFAARYPAFAATIVQVYKSMIAGGIALMEQQSGGPVQEPYGGMYQ